MKMPNTPTVRRQPRAGYRLASGFVLGLAMVAAGVSAPGSGGRTVVAQGANPCALVTTDDVKPFASVKQSVGNGAATSQGGPSGCRYIVGEGMDHLTLDVIVADPARMFAGMGPDMIKQALQTSVRAETADAVIPEVGDAAIFKAESPLYTRTTAYVKGRILQLQLDGLDAIDRKDQMIALLKTAASRL